MSVSTGIFPDDLLFDTHYQWIKAAGNTVLFGLTPYGLEITGDILYLSLPPVGAAVAAGNACGSLEAGKWVGRVYAPVSGRVTRINETVLASPALIGHNPFHNWFAEIELSRSAELHELMDAAGVRVWLARELKDNA